MATISRHQTVIFGIFTHLTAESAITREIQWVLTNRGYRRGVPVPPPRLMEGWTVRVGPR